MNIIKKIMDSGSKPELVSIPAGQFFLLRPESSPKSTLECLYNDATLAIRESGSHRFELVVRKEVDDTELTSGDGGEDFEDDGLSVLSGQSKKEEEWSFNLDKSLHFRKSWSEQGEVAFVWRNTKGDAGEKFQFVVNSEIPLTDVGHFLHTVNVCEYEHKFKKQPSTATRENLRQFEFSHRHDEEAISDEDGDENDENNEDSQLGSKMGLLDLGNSSSESDDGFDSQEFEDAKDNFGSPKHPKQSVKVPNPPNAKTLLREHAALLVYDPTQQQFSLQDPDCGVSILDHGKFEYWLQINGKVLELGVDLTPLVNPFFQEETLCFIFNYSYETITLSYMLKFSDEATFSEFQQQWSKSLWEALNKQKWSAISEKEQRCISNANRDVDKELSLFLQDDDDSSSADSEESDENDEEEEEEEAEREIQSDVDSFDEDKKEEEYRSSTALSGNKSLTVSYKNDRSFVVRGDKIGVFKVDDENNEVNFVTAINNVSSLKGRNFEPENPMLYTEDRAMIVQDKENPSLVFKMDLERGKVVEEWSAGGKDVLKYSHSKKFDQLTNEQTFLGVSGKSVFRLDPRISGANKLVTEQNKDYATNNKFSSLGTTQEGFLAVGSEKGEIRLFDKIGLRAKTLIPALGEPINHICNSADGKWLLATCDSSLLLIDLTIKEGKNAGSVGFVKSFSKEEMPNIFVLKIHPKTAAYMRTSAKQPIKFTKAYFNTGLNQKEQTIVTSTGPFAITWSLKKVLKGEKMSYRIKRYNSMVMEDNFRYGSDKNVILALKDNVKMAKKTGFKEPSKEMTRQNNWNEFLELSEKAAKRRNQ